MQEMTLPIITNDPRSDVKVIAIEGCNGTGKTTLLNAYTKLHTDVECKLCVPKIYQTAKDTKHYMLYESTALCSALYYLGGAVEVKATHNKNYSKIVFDRSVWSTFAAAYSKDESILSELFGCLKAIRNYVFIPDHIVVLDATYETCKQRIMLKQEGAEFDKDSYNQFEKKRHFYKMLKEVGYPMSFIDVNNLTEKGVLLEFEEIANKVFNL